MLLIACDRGQARTLAQYRVDHLAFPVRLRTSSPSDTDSFTVSRPTGGGAKRCFSSFRGMILSSKDAYAHRTLGFSWIEIGWLLEATEGPYFLLYHLNIPGMFIP